VLRLHHATALNHFTAMTPSEWIAAQRAKIARIQSGNVLFEATTLTMIQMQRRIWTEGRLTDGSQIGYKENYEVWMYKPPFPQKPNGKGKPFDLWERKGEVATDRAELRSLTRRAQQVRRAREAQGNKGKQRKIKGQWAPTYLAAKDAQGRKDFPFELTGDMRISWLGGPVPSPRVSSGGLVCEIVMAQEQWNKAAGIAKQKGEFLELTEFELKYQAEQVQRLINEALR
jgi:hypothetical protein